MTAGRVYATGATPLVRQHLESLARLVGQPDAYRGAMRVLGQDMGKLLAPKLKADAPVVLICTAEDADFLAAGLLKAVEQQRPELAISLVCFWNERYTVGPHRVAPIIRRYVEPLPQDPASVVVVKSLISGACVVQTNLSEILERLPAPPEAIHVVAPVMHKDAARRLEEEFSPALAERFAYLYLALDSHRDPATSRVSPGLGEGDFYQNLGWRDQEEKNRYRPLIVQERNERAFQAPLPRAHAS